jgi:hypothetical protein
MRRLRVITPAFVLIAACGSGPTPQEKNLSERGEAPEQLAGGPGNIAAGTAPASEQGQLGDTMPDNAAGPRSDRGSGTGGDSVPSQ